MTLHSSLHLPQPFIVKWNLCQNTIDKYHHESPSWHSQCQSIQKLLSDDTHVIYYQKKQSNMMSSVPCESTQKMLPNDTHIIYYQKRQWNMMPSFPWESTQKMLSDDTHIICVTRNCNICHSLSQMHFYTTHAPTAGLEYIYSIYIPQTYVNIHK